MKAWIRKNSPFLLGIIAILLCSTGLYLVQTHNRGPVWMAFYYVCLGIAVILVIVAHYINRRNQL